eukprot:scaffold149_cov315-Pinguiococcus_pyrenoidosus.AAC.4
MGRAPAHYFPPFSLGKESIQRCARVSFRFTSSSPPLLCAWSRARGPERIACFRQTSSSELGRKELCS